MPDTDIETAYCDVAAEFCHDFLVTWSHWFEKWSADKENQEKKLVEEILPKFYENIEKEFLANNRKFIASDKVEMIGNYAIKVVL